MSKLEECHKIVEDYLQSQESGSSSRSIRVDAGVKYLMAQQYIEGYNAGQSAIISKLAKDE